MPWINQERCDSCGDCAKICILDAITLQSGKAVIIPRKCHRCGACHEICPENAIYYGKPKLVDSPVDSTRKLAGDFTSLPQVDED